MPLLQRRAVQATCSKCHTTFLVEPEAAGTACLCPGCGDDVQAPAAPLKANPVAIAAVGLAGLAALVAAIWWASPSAPPLATDAQRDEQLVQRPAKVTYQPEIDLPKLDLQNPLRAAAPPTIPSSEDFAATTASLFAQNDAKQAEPKQADPKEKQSDPKQADPKQPDAAAPGEEVKELADAIAAFRRQDLTTTKALLEKAAQAHADLPPPAFMLAELFLSANQGVLGRQELEQTAIKHPRYAGTYMQFGSMALAEGRVTDALLQFEKARSLEGELPESSRKKKIQGAIRMGLVSVSEARQDWPAARDAAEQWLTSDPTNGRARTRLAKALLGLGKAQEAQRELERAFTEDKDQQPPEAAMAAFYTELGDTKSAATWLEKALAAHPKNFRIAMFAAAWYMERERLADAQPLAARAQELDTTSVDAKLLCAVVARQQRNFREAEKWLELAMRDAPASFPVSNQLALVLAEQEDDQKRRRAIELAEVNARQYPRSPDAASTLGWAYYRGGRVDQAESALQAAVSNGRASSDTAYFLAHVLAERGKLDAASRLLQDALRANGPFTYRNEAKKWLDRITGKPGPEPGKEPATKEPAAKEPPTKEAPKK